MRERVGGLLGGGEGGEREMGEIVLGTFHAVCRRFLARWGGLVGLKKGWGILESTDQGALVKVSEDMRFEGRSWFLWILDSMCRF